MIFLAKGFEAIGIASVLLGLVQGIQTNDMWAELYLSLFGILLFLLGYGIEKFLNKRNQKRQVARH